MEGGAGKKISSERTEKKVVEVLSSAFITCEK